MNIVITIDGDITDADRAIFRALAGEAAPASPFVDTLPKAEPKPKAEKPAAPSKTEKPAAPAKTEKPAAPAKAEKPAAPTKAEEDPAPSEEKSTVETAVAKAAELLGAGKVARVKEILAELGVSRVSQLSPTQATEFLGKVEGE